MQRIIWLGRKSDKIVLEFIDEKRELIDSIRKERWNVVKLLYAILDQRKKTPG